MRLDTVIAQVKAEARLRFGLRHPGKEPKLGANT